MRTPIRSVVVVSSLLVFGGCGSVTMRSDGSSSGGTSGADAGTGGNGGGAAGHAGTGGATATGGATGTGGATATGGVPGTGGASATGGASGNGGASATGGASGNGGASATGGASGNGGAKATGGATGTGGVTATGGSPGTGGVIATGGSPGTGGSPPPPPCDSNSDGLDDTASCVTSPVYLRFVNATASQTFDVYVTGATSPVTTGLAAYQVKTVGPVQAKLLDYEFRTSGVAPVTGEVNLLANNRYSLVAYLDPTTTVPTLKTNSAPQLTAGGCGSTGAQIAFGEFTTLKPAPVVILYTTNGGTSWTPPISPGLSVGQIFGSGCWNGGTALQFGAGPASATTPTVKYQAVTFTDTLTYQLLMTDDRIIEIDNLDRVSNLPKL